VIRTVLDLIAGLDALALCFITIALVCGALCVREGHENKSQFLVLLGILLVISGLYMLMFVFIFWR